ncbi:hypothetical protein VNO77_04774 [Canavalia gladiata]|uniref:Uncharacterized protein n=1 Tax=Canavalia gladiata TaxID=3824 RepID=A0AAN9MX56_CANGL
MGVGSVVIETLKETVSITMPNIRTPIQCGNFRVPCIFPNVIVFSFFSFITCAKKVLHFYFCLSAEIALLQKSELIVSNMKIKQLAVQKTNPAPAPALQSNQ